MIVVNGRDIKVSEGDTLVISFNVAGVNLKDARATFTVKRTPESTRPEIVEQMTIEEGGRLSLKVPAETMRHVTPGTYVYDVLVEDKNGRVTLNFPARFEVIGVVHNA